MSHATPPKATVARKHHRCTWCGQGIWPGDTYSTWGSIDGEHWFTNKMHTACQGAMHADIAAGGDREYMPWSNEPPEIFV